MRDRMERFVLLPFSVGCVSESSIAVAIQQQSSRKSAASSENNHKNFSSSSSAIRNREEDEESFSSNESMKSNNTTSFRSTFLAISKPDISTGFHRLFKSFKTISQLFVYKEEEMEELEKEIEIGFPTDVKHVTHIGIDGSSSNNIINNNNINHNNIPIKGWEDFINPSVSLEEFQLSMASQASAAQAANHDLLKDS